MALNHRHDGGRRGPLLAQSGHSAGSARRRRAIFDRLSRLSHRLMSVLPPKQKGRMRLRQPPLGPHDAASQIAHVQQMLPHAAVLDTKHVDRARLYSSFHLIEQPIDAFWSAGARPVVAIARMASTSSRGAPARGGVVRPSSSRPRYLSLRSAL